MGFIRGLLVVFVSIALLLSVLCSSIFYTISSSLDYGIVQTHAINVVQPWVEQMNLTQVINSEMGTINQYCASNSDFVFSYQGYTFQFSCQDVNNTQAIINDAVKNFVSNIYYQQYNCTYWDCFSKYTPPLFLISEKSQQYWYNLFYISSIVAVLSAISLFFLFKRKYDLLFLSGGIFIASGLLILGIEKLVAILSNQIISNIALIFLSQTSFVFLRLIIAGGILILAGLIVELFRAGFKIYDMFSRFREPEEKPEAEKVKPQKKKK